ncbi:hypothetical protein ACHAPT_011009 [Fusarium lateritium]
MEPVFEKVEGGVSQLLKNCWFMRASFDTGMTLDQFLSNGLLTGEPNANYDCYDAADQSYIIPLITLEEYIPMVGPGRIPVLGEGRSMRYDGAAGSWASLTNRQKFWLDRCILQQHLTDLTFAAHHARGWQVEDEFLRGVRLLTKESPMPLSLVFTAQAFLDIQHELGASSSRRIFMAMTGEVEIMDGMLASHLELHKNIRDDKRWPPAQDVQLRDVRRLIASMAKDPVHELKVREFGKQGELTPERERHRAFILSPVLAGLYLFLIRAMVHRIGINVANAWSSIMCCAHLQNALGSGHDWPDLDTTITQLGVSNLWVGEEEPKTMQDCFSQYVLRMGNSAANFAKNRRQRHNTPQLSRGGVRRIKGGVPVSSVFTKIAFGEATEITWTPELIQDITARSAYETITTDDGQIYLERIDNQRELTAKNRLRQQKAKVEVVEAHELIKSLVYVLEAESTEMIFPYLLMHRNCWNLLEGIKSISEPVLKEPHYIPAYLNRDSDVVNVVGCILSATNGIDGHGRGIEPDFRMLETARLTWTGIRMTGMGQKVIELVRQLRGMRGGVKDNQGPKDSGRAISSEAAKG